MNKKIRTHSSLIIYSYLTIHPKGIRHMSLISFLVLYKVSSFNEGGRLSRGFLRLLIDRYVIVFGRLSREQSNLKPKERCVKEGG
jgi:hypothetical protein